MARILVTGGNGMLARDLTPLLTGAGHRVSSPGHRDLDITRPDDLRRAFDALSPDMVMNCAAYTAVDRAEEEPDAAFAVNRDGPAHLAEACAERDVPLLHISTDFVFDGRSRTPYTEDDPTAPLNVYGMSKRDGEDAVRRVLDRHIMVRTAWLFGAHGGNFVSTMLRLAHERTVLRVVDDQTGCPTWTGDLAAAITVMAGHALGGSGPSPWGTFHYCGGGMTTWYGLACAVIEEARRHEALAVERIEPVTTGEFPRPASRPSWSVLDTARSRSVFGIEPLSWREGVRRMVGSMYGAR